MLPDLEYTRRGSGTPLVVDESTSTPAPRRTDTEAGAGAADYRTGLTALVLAIAAGFGLSFVTISGAPEVKTDAEMVVEREEAIQDACASSDTFQGLKKLVFDQAARIRTGERVNFDVLAATANPDAFADLRARSPRFARALALAARASGQARPILFDGDPAPGGAVDPADDGHRGREYERTGRRDDEDRDEDQHLDEAEDAHGSDRGERQLGIQLCPRVHEGRLDIEDEEEDRERAVLRGADPLHRVQRHRRVLRHQPDAGAVVGIAHGLRAWSCTVGLMAWTSSRALEM